jgi:xylulokinase
MTFDKPVLKEKMMDSDLCCYDHCYPKRYCSIGMILTGGASFGWYKNQFGFEDSIKAKEKNRNVYEQIISNFESEPTNLYFIPHLSGSGTPKMNPRATGTLFGITLGTDKYDIGKSVLEGLNFEIKLNIDIIESLGITTINEIKCISGGAKSDFWLQLKANILNKEITASEFADAPAIGAAILAGYSSGVFKTLEEGIQATSSSWRKFYPDRNMVKKYEEKYSKYIEIRNIISENLY